MLDRTPSAWSGLWFGIALGAALLTKAYFTALLPLAVIVLWLSWRRHDTARRQAVLQAVAALCSSIAIAGWWYVHNLVDTGSLTGQFEDIQGTANSVVSLIGAVAQIHWTRIFDFMATSQIWLGGWSFLGLRSWMYRLGELVAILAIAGISVQTVRKRAGLPRPSDLWLLALPYIAMVAGLCFYAVQVFRTRGSGATPGYYLCALAVPEAVLLVAGLARLMPVKLQLLPVPVVALALVAIEQFGVWFIMLPYYAGLIRHLATGALPAARIQQYWKGGELGEGGLATFFVHLSGIGPVSSPALLEAIAILYGLATAVLLWSAYRIYASTSRTAKP
jgi:hypothetical protein